MKGYETLTDLNGNKLQLRVKIVKNNLMSC